MSIAQNILEIVEEVQQEKQFKQIRKIYVKIGKMVAVVPESLQFCFTTLTTGTPWESTQLVIDIIPILLTCQECSKEFQPDSMIFRCPHCQSNQVTLIHGQELQVSELEVE